MSNIDLQSNLPKEVKDYLTSPDIIERNNQIITKYNLLSQKKIYFGIILKLFLKEITPFTLSGVLIKTLNIKDDKKIKSLVEDIEKIILSPVSNYFSGDHKIINYQWKILMDNVIEKNNLTFNDKKIKNRFYEIIESFLSEARTKEQFYNTLVKKIESGGMGIDKDAADIIVEAIASYLGKKEEKKLNNEKLSKDNIKKGDEVDIKIQKPEEQRDKLIKAPTIKKDEVSFKKEEQEVEKEKQELKKTIKLTEQDINKKLAKPFLQNKKNKDNEDAIVLNTDKSTDVVTALNTNHNTNKIIDKILIDIKLDFPSTELNDRFKKLIESILREVRTPEQVLERLTLDIKKGGLGMGSTEADKLLDKINNAVKLETGNLYFKKLDEIKKVDKKTRELELENRVKKQKNQQQELDDRYHKLVSKNKKVNKVKPEIKEVKYKSNAKPKAKTGKITIQEEEVPYFNIPKSDSGRPILEDIKFKTKLYGPVEEIERFGLDDMRKLSRDPKEALLKIKDKISLLRDESFAKFQDAKSAWQKSPLYSEYLDILDQSLNANLSIEEVLKSRNTLTQSEFNAIMEAGLGS